MKRLAAWVLVLAMLWAGNMAALAEEKCCCCCCCGQKEEEIEETDDIREFTPELDYELTLKGVYFDDFIQRWGWLCVELGVKIEPIESIEDIENNTKLAILDGIRKFSTANTVIRVNADQTIGSREYRYGDDALEESKMSLFAFLYAARDELWINGKDYVLKWIRDNGEKEWQALIDNSKERKPTKWGITFFRIDYEENIVKEI